MALRSLIVALLVLGTALFIPSAAVAAPYLPPKGTIWHGVTSGEDLVDFRTRAGRPPAVWQQFVQWGGNYEYVFKRAAGPGGGARVMLHLSTAGGQNQPEVISPGAIARGRGDAYLLRLNRSLAAYGKPAYIRPFGEMNNCNNAYAAFNCSGTRRDAAHSARRLKQAYKRTYLILRGGDVGRIDRRLRALRLAPVRTAAAALPRPPVAFVWAPMTGGSPMIPALAPGVYWPGRRWVDWVGTSFYSRFPNFRYLEPFYRRWAVAERKPFAFAEWAMWGGDDAGFARRLYAWVRRHRAVRMMQYNQGDRLDGPFRLRRYPRASRVMRRALSSPRFAGLSTARR